MVGENSQPQGPADLATWQSRRIRLMPEGDRVVGVIVCNGDKIPDAGANVLDDPMTPYRFSTNKSKKDHDVYYPRPYDVERTMWKALD
ncbi:type I-E CRISPR-associated protein Cse1/CasA, partial [Enterococcus faecalis]|uniref:type I-E CRISPR-associated protein Cse1/CasA n=1 Tax=Enterococcus faecalis TaxID=1351 RepID=UPI003CC5933C